MNDKNKNNLVEQEAPQKNTDDAFVKVGEDGRPQVPEITKENKEEDNRTTDLDKR